MSKYAKRSEVFEIERQGPLLRRLVGASMRAGYVPRDAVKRASEALHWIRSEARENYWGTKHQNSVVALVVQGLQCGGESGQVIAARAIEAYRLCQEHMATERRREASAKGRNRDTSPDQPAA